jgi:hypothetical protein
MTSKTAVTRARQLQHRKPLPAKAILRRLGINQADIAYVAECSQGNVSNMLNARCRITGAVEEAITLLVNGEVTRAALFGPVSS